MQKNLLKRKSNISEFPNQMELNFDFPRMKHSADYLFEQASKLVKELKPMVSNQVIPITDRDELIGIRETARILNVCVKTVSRYRYLYSNN